MDVRPINSGWCNGDLGIIACLWTSACALEDADLETEVLSLAALEAERRVEDVEPDHRQNPALCHGGAGRAHIFNRLFQGTGHERFQEASLYWMRHVLDLVEARLRDPDPPLEPGFLMGLAGVGLMLTAAVTDTPPSWDCVLLASSPAAAA